ncbi:hypothetical protein KM043_010084 [Ampulex compressa]|nr:hypothetical protein KM043_010084 [Ampulex compressa]
MGNLKYIIILATVFLYVDFTAAHYKVITAIGLTENGCDCIRYDCGCCQYMDWSPVLNGSLCVNASYLEEDYGISITLTFNDIAIINETVSARNPPPICVGEDIVTYLQLDVCLKIYDIRIHAGKFHACFQLNGKIAKMTIAKLPLGCVDTKASAMVKTSARKFSDICHKFMYSNTPEQVPVVNMV